jgi:hypothetical protein
MVKAWGVAIMVGTESMEMVSIITIAPPHLFRP